MADIRKGADSFFVGEDPGERLAEIAFRREEGGRIVIDHTSVSDGLKGRGVGAELVEAVVGLARAEGAMIRPVCPYARKLMLKTPEYADVLFLN